MAEEYVLKVFRRDGGEYATIYTQNKALTSDQLYKLIDLIEVAIDECLSDEE